MKLISVDEVAKLLGCTRHTVYNYCRAKKIPYVKLGRYIRIPEEGLAEVIEKNMVRAKEQKNA